MAYNTKPIVTDKDGKPISQYYNPDTDNYEPVEGSHGANKVMVGNHDLSLIVDKLSQLTGTVIDEETRKSNENIRKSNEDTRKSNELQRIDNEEIRIQNENTRVQNENIRQTNEDTRIVNENARVLAEQERATTFAGYENRVTNVENDLAQHKLDYASQRQQDQLKLAKVEKDINDYKQVMSQVNINQEAKQSVSGYGILSLPKNAANGQINEIKIFGNTEEEDNVKSTLGAIRLKSVGKNLLNVAAEYVNRNTVIDRDVITTVFESGVLHFNANKRPIRLKPNTKYTYSVYSATDSPISMGLYVYDRNDTLLKVHDVRNAISSSVTITTPDDGFVAFCTNGISGFYNKYSYRLQVEEGETPTEYEPYKESTLYVIAKDEEGNILELRSLPNDVKDEIDVANRKLIKRIEVKSNITSGTIINFADMAEGGTYFAWNENGETETGNKGDILGIDATVLTYQLAEPIITPIQVSGNLITYPSGTIYIEPVVADAGIYTSNGITILHQELPIDYIEKISKIDFETGIETELDTSQAVISEDGTYFTHPELVEGDIVFFEYYYPSDMTTQGETEIEYYDSRYVIQDSVTGKFYKWKIAVANGTPTIELEEV